MRSLKREMLSSLLVLALPIVIAAIFPYSAIGFRATEHRSENAGSSAFVTLAADALEKALANARTAWQNGRTGEARMASYLSLGDLPEVEDRQVSGVIEMPIVAVEMPVISVDLPIWEPSLAAKKPETMTDRPIVVKRPPTFSREEMLKIN